MKTKSNQRGKCFDPIYSQGVSANKYYQGSAPEQRNRWEFGCMQMPQTVTVANFVVNNPFLRLIAGMDYFFSFLSQKMFWHLLILRKGGDAKST